MTIKTITKAMRWLCSIAVAAGFVKELGWFRGLEVVGAILVAAVVLAMLNANSNPPAPPTRGAW